MLELKQSASSRQSLNRRQQCSSSLSTALLTVRTQNWCLKCLKYPPSASTQACRWRNHSYIALFTVFSLSCAHCSFSLW